jgi:hypothetical protein
VQIISAGRRSQPCHFFVLTDMKERPPGLAFPAAFFASVVLLLFVLLRR